VSQGLYYALLRRLACIKNGECRVTSNDKVYTPELCENCSCSCASQISINTAVIANANLGSSEWGEWKLVNTKSSKTLNPYTLTLYVLSTHTYDGNVFSVSTHVHVAWYISWSTMLSTARYTLYLARHSVCTLLCTRINSASLVHLVVASLHSKRLYCKVLVVATYMQCAYSWLKASSKCAVSCDVYNRANAYVTSDKSMCMTI
jgi:hypothetical protein